MSWNNEMFFFDCRLAAEIFSVLIVLLHTFLVLIYHIHNNASTQTIPATLQTQIKQKVLL